MKSSSRCRSEMYSKEDLSNNNTTGSFEFATQQRRKMWHTCRLVFHDPTFLVFWLLLVWYSTSFNPCFVAAFSQHSQPQSVHRRNGEIANVTPTQSQTAKATNPTSPATETLLRELYPPLAPYQNGTLRVDSIHTLYYEQYGSDSADAIPALFLHGGPGAGCFPRHAQFFDSSKYRIVLLDQRGSGRSTPRGEIRNNTIRHLVDDCETLRDALGIQQWGVIFGGSWGSTLALAYAQEHPTRVLNLLLRGVCLLRPQEVDWMFGEQGVARDERCRDAWRSFREAVGLDGREEEHSMLQRNALHAHYDRLLSSDRATQLGAARSWMKWESTVSSLSRRETNHSIAPDSVLVGRPVGGKRVWGFRNAHGDVLSPPKLQQSPHKFKESLRKGLAVPALTPRQETMRPIQPIQTSPESPPVGQSLPSQWADYVPAQAMLTCFFSVNDRYVMSNLNLLDRVDRIQNIPCIAVQGGLDPICPVDSALDLCRVYRTMELRIPLASGHSMYEAAMTNELLQATDRFASSLYRKTQSTARSSPLME
jgi:proline iminopeptidase